MSFVNKVGASLKTQLFFSVLYTTASACIASDDVGGSANVQAVEENTQAQLSKVTVTARRRAEDAQEIPAPLTTLTGTQLEDQKISKVQDLQQALPSVNVSFFNPRQASIAVRGIGNNPANDGLEGSTGIYLDNIYLGRPGMAVFDLMDIEQLELLRGPQGTLFGKNTTAGVLNISTRKPTFSKESSFEVSGAERDYSQVKGTVSGPLTDTLAGRVSVYQTREDGYLHNIYNGDDLNGGVRKGVRTQLLYEPDEDFNLRWIADYNQEKSTSGTWSLYGVTDFYRQRAALSGAHPQYNSKKRAVNLNSDTSTNVDQGGTSLEANWVLGSGHTLTSVTGYRYFNFSPKGEDNLDITVWHSAGVDVEDKQFSQEIRLASPSNESFDYVIGAFWFNQNLKNKSSADYGPDADIFLTGTNSGVYNNVLSQYKGEIDSDSYAVFSQGTWHLTDKLDFTVGVRGTYEEKEARVRRADPVASMPSSAAVEAARQRRMGALDTGAFGLHGTSPSGLLSLSYKISPELMTYASLSHGEKSGGVNLGPPAPGLDSDSLVVGPERANNAELGFKGTFLNRRLQVNSNIFWTGIHGYQATSLTTLPGQAVSTSILTNAGSVRSRGIEVDISALLHRDLTLNFTGSYNDVAYLSFKDAPCPAEVTYGSSPQATCDLTGQNVAGASKWIGNVSFKYLHRYDNGVSPYFTGAYSYRSDSEGTLDNSDYSKMDGYGLLSLTAGLRSDMGGGEVDVSLWIKNVTDKVYYQSAFAQPNGLYTASMGQPRTVGMSLRYDF